MGDNGWYIHILYIYIVTECDRYFMTCRFTWILFSLPIDFHWLLRLWSQSFGFIWRMEMRWFLRYFSHISNVVSIFFIRNMCFFSKIFFLLIWNWYSRISFRFLDSRFSSGDFRQVGKNYGRENNKIFGGKLRQGTILAIFFLDSMPQLLAFGDGTLW